MKVGVGSSVDRADAPVSPRKSAPKLLDFCRGRGIVYICDCVVAVVIAREWTGFPKGPW